MMRGMWSERRRRRGRGRESGIAGFATAVAVVAADGLADALALGVAEFGVAARSPAVGDSTLSAAGIIETDAALAAGEVRPFALTGWLPFRVYSGVLGPAAFAFSAGQRARRGEGGGWC